MGFAIFPLHLSKVPRLPRKSDARSYEVPVTQNHLCKPEDLTLQNATPLKKSAPWSPNTSNSCVSCTALATRHASLQILFKCPTLANVLKLLQNLDVFAHFCTIPSACHAKRHLNVQKVLRTPQFFDCFLHFWLRNVLRATTACTFSTSQLAKKWSKTVSFLHFSLPHVLRATTVCTFSTSTSKSAKLRCFVHFDFEMCFAPQRRALFRHHNFQKWSDVGVLCTFWVGNVLRTTTTCNFSSLIWPDGSAPAALVSLLFDPPEPHIMGKRQCCATFLPFRAPGSSFFWDFLFSDLLSSALFSSTLLFSALLFSLPLPISAFHLSILSEVWLLNFLHLPSLPRKLAWKKLKKSESHRQWMCWLWVCQSLDGVGLTLSRSYIHIHLQSFYVFCSWHISGTHIFQIALPIHMLQIDEIVFQGIGNMMINQFFSRVTYSETNPFRNCFMLL